MSSCTSNFQIFLNVEIEKEAVRQFYFSDIFIVTTWHRRRLLIFQTKNYFRSNSINLNYQKVYSIRFNGVLRNFPGGDFPLKVSKGGTSPQFSWGGMSRQFPRPPHNTLLIRLQRSRKASCIFYRNRFNNNSWS